MFDRYALIPLGAFGFVGETGDVNRFAARYRAAKSFKGATFEGLTHDTADGYSALCRLLLTYSAFEYCLRAIGVQMRHTGALLADDEREQVQKHLRQLAGQAELMRFLKAHVESRFRTQIDQHLAGAPANPFYLAASMRHAFAHGALTATPAGVPSGTVASVARYLVRVLFRVVDREFERRMVEFEAILAGE